MWFGHRDVPLDRDASARFLPWLIAFMVYLAALALAGASAVDNLAARWDTGLAGRITVQVPPPPADNGAQQAGSARAEAVVQALRRQPGVRDARVIPEARMQELLAPWLGEGVAQEGLPLPRLVAVTVDPRSPPPLSALQQAAQSVAPGAVVDDHQRTLGRVLESVRALQLLALLVVGLVVGAAVITVVFVTRTGLAVHQKVIELLHLIGAQDGYVAAQFERHAMRQGLVGGGIGLALALVTLVGLGQLIETQASAVIPDPRLRLWQWAVLLVLPPTAALVAMVTARLTVLRTLARLA